MSVTLLNVLNTVSPLGVDARVDANGYLNLQGTPAFKASSIDSVVITPYAAEVAQQSTVTITSASTNALFSLSLICNDVNSGMITSVPLTVTSDSSTSATEICDAFRAAINSMPELSVTASGTSTLVVTAKAGFPTFTLSTTDSKMTIATGTTGVVGTGSGASLIGLYPSTAGYFSAGGFTAAANIVATNNYTQVLVTSTTGGSAVILVKYDATNVGDLLGTYGTITGLKAGYRVTGVAYDSALSFTGAINNGTVGQAGTILTAGTPSAGTITVGEGLSGTNVAPGTFVTAQLTGTPGGAGTYSVNISQSVSSTTITSGVVTIATNVATFTSATTISMGILPGDFIVADPAGTPSIGYVLVLSADGTAVYNNAVSFVTNANVSAKGYNVFKWRALPL
jgi:hypothetical protein